nr:MAG TPA: hypothetical protein [Caudoviricetes sp.]
MWGAGWKLSAFAGIHAVFYRRMIRSELERAAA